MSFHDDLIGMLPRLRRHAMSLTRDRHAMEDLVQNAVVRALNAQDSFQPGTNFAGWMHKILRNEFISGLRKTRNTVALDDLAAERAATAETHEDHLVVRELEVALDKLPPAQREAVMLATLSELSHEQIAEVMGCRVGTVKSRICRARRQLQAYLMGEEIVVTAADESVADGEESVVDRPERPQRKAAPRAVSNQVP
jgi:RNA polymerase sigma-70 factor (ECF subfamily)